MGCSRQRVLGGQGGMGAGLGGACVCVCGWGGAGWRAHLLRGPGARARCEGPPGPAVRRGRGGASVGSDGAPARAAGRQIREARTHANLHDAPRARAVFEGLTPNGAPGPRKPQDGGCAGAPHLLPRGAAADAGLVRRRLTLVLPAGGDCQRTRSPRDAAARSPSSTRFAAPRAMPHTHQPIKSQPPPIYYILFDAIPSYPTPSYPIPSDPILSDWRPQVRHIRRPGHQPELPPAAVPHILQGPKAPRVLFRLPRRPRV